MSNYPTELKIDYPNKKLNRLTTFFRIFLALPILFVLSSVSGSTVMGEGGEAIALGAGGSLFLGPLLMIVFRQKYPRWWFDWNTELLRFTTRVFTYLALMTDQYPSTDQTQNVKLNIKYPDVKKELNQYLPLVKWFLAIPHYILLIFIDLFAVIVVLIAWFSILFTGNYPKSLFNFIEGVMRWNIRVTSYAFLLTTDKYPPFSFK